MFSDFLNSDLASVHQPINSRNQVVDSRIDPYTQIPRGRTTEQGLKQLRTEIRHYSTEIDKLRRNMDQCAKQGQHIYESLDEEVDRLKRMQKPKVLRRSYSSLVSKKAVSRNERPCTCSTNRLKDIDLAREVKTVKKRLNSKARGMTPSKSFIKVESPVKK